MIKSPGHKTGATGRSHFELSDRRRLDWLRLIRSENVGPATFRDLLNHFGSASAALDALPDLAKRGSAAARISVATQDDAEREMEAANLAGAYFVGLGESDYPPLLRRMDQPPPLVCLKGDAGIAANKPIAIVGSRNASIAGMKLASRFATELGQSGCTIVSGLARGIDATAHEAALATGTVAVFAGGADHAFPPENRELAKRIAAEGGLIVSEMPMGWRPRGKDFPRRNRIISGLSLGVLVVEAARRSGSLITARLANEAGRQVFAIPGSPLDPRADGTNHLIKQGAALVTSHEDILEAISALDSRNSLFSASEESDAYAEETVQPAGRADADEAVRARIIASLGPSPVEVDDIIRFADATTAQVQLVLIELDLAGELERHGGNRVSISR